MFVIRPFRKNFTFTRENLNRDLASHGIIWTFLVKLTFYIFIFYDLALVDKKFIFDAWNNCNVKMKNVRMCITKMTFFMHVEIFYKVLYISAFQTTFSYPSKTIYINMSLNVSHIKKWKMFNIILRLTSACTSVPVAFLPTP